MTVATYRVPKLDGTNKLPAKYVPGPATIGAATAAQGAKADTATQPADLTAGLAGKQDKATLGAAVAADATVLATLVPRPAGGADGQALVKSGTDIVWGAGGGGVQLPFVNAADYGLATAATAATNATAITNAWSAGQTQGRPVYLPPGTYQCNPVTLTAYDGARLFGSGAGFDDAGRKTTQLVSNAGAGVNFLTINTGGASTKAWNVVLEDFEMAGTGADGNGLLIGDQTGVIGPYTVRRVTARNFGAAGFCINGKLDHGYWEACVSRNNPIGYDVGGGGNKFISETTFVACHGSFNTQYGWKIRPSGSSTILTGSESSSNSVAGLWIGSQSTAPHYVRVQGHHAENNTTYAVDIANSTASCTVVLDGLRVMDSSASGIAVAVNVAAQFKVHVAHCYFELKNANAVGVKEAAGSYVTYGEHNQVLNFTGTNTLYLRQDPNGVLTNYRQGFARKAADQFVTNTTTNTADTDLAVYVPPTGTYEVDGFIIYDSSTTADFALGFVTPTGATFDWHSQGITSGAASATDQCAARRWCRRTPRRHAHHGPARRRHDRRHLRDDLRPGCRRGDEHDGSRWLLAPPQARRLTRTA
jgi:hypothetical protein